MPHFMNQPDDIPAAGVLPDEQLEQLIRNTQIEGHRLESASTKDIAILLRIVRRKITLLNENCSLNLSQPKEAVREALCHALMAREWLEHSQRMLRG